MQTPRNWQDIASQAATRRPHTPAAPVDVNSIVGQAIAGALGAVSDDLLDRIKGEALRTASDEARNTANQLLDGMVEALISDGRTEIKNQLDWIFKQAYAQAKADAAITVTIAQHDPAGQCVGHTAVGITHRNFQHLVRIATSRDGAGYYCHTALVGEAGSGKSYGAEQLANAIGVDFQLVACHQKMNAADIRGYTIGSDYFASPVYTAYKHGGILCLDEFDRTNTEVTIALNTVLAGSSHLFPNGEKVKRHADFRAVACQNTFGTGTNRTYTAATRLDASSTDRFEFLTWNVDEAMELAVAGDTVATRTVQALRRRAFDLAMDLIISPRRAISTNALMRSGYTLEEALNFAILNRVSDDQRLRLLEGINLNA